MSIKTASFASTYSASILVSSTKQDEDSYKSLVQFSSTSENKGYYSWNFAEIENTYADILQEIGASSILGVSINFWYNLSSDGKALDILKHGFYFDDNPETAQADRILADTSVISLGSVVLKGSTQTNISLDLDDLDGFFYDVQTRIGQRSHVTLAFVRSDAYSSSAGSVEIGGTSLVSGGSDWRAALSNELTSPPLLIVKYSVPEVSQPVLKMKYTTQDPTVPQNSPSNSIGGFASSNEVYPSSDISGSINSTQTYVPIDSNSPLPVQSSGLASVGPEVFSYTGIDEVGHKLIGITRGLSPRSSFPAGFDSFLAPEKVYYLHPNSNNVNKLFDTSPSSRLIQYRCVAISNDDSSSDFSIQDAFIGVTQDPNSNVQITIGVEFPQHDAQSGTIDSSSNTNSLTDVTFSSYAVGFFNGDLIKIFNGSSNSARGSTTISSFDGSGNFILTDSISGMSASDRFVIFPSPSQRIPNDATSPSSSSGRFTGFSEDLSGIDITLTENGNTMKENDVFYVWIKRVLKPNKLSSDNSGAILLFRFRS